MRQVEPERRAGGMKAARGDRIARAARVAVLGLQAADVEPALPQAGARELPGRVVLQAHAVDEAQVVDEDGLVLGLRDPLPGALEAADGEHGLGVEVGRPGAEGPQPEGAAAVPGVHALAAVLLGELQPVLGAERVRRHRRPFREVEGVLGIDVREAWIEPLLAELHGVAKGLGVPPARGDEPRAIGRRRAVRQAAVQAPDLDSPAIEIPRHPGRHRHQAAVAVAEVGGQAAGVDVDAVDDAAVDDAERALEAPQVERLVELEAVEDERDVPRLAAADAERGRVVGRGDAGELLDDAAHVAADRRREHGVVVAHAERRRLLLAHDRELARRDDDLLDEGRIALFIGWST